MKTLPNLDLENILLLKNQKFEMEHADALNVVAACNDAIRGAHSHYIILLLSLNYLVRELQYIEGNYASFTIICEFYLLGEFFNYVIIRIRSLIHLEFKGNIFN